MGLNERRKIKELQDEKLRRLAGTMRQPAPAVAIEFTGDDAFVVVDGTRVAKRGDMEWVQLEPGVQVISPPDHEYIDISFDAARVQ